MHESSTSIYRRKVQQHRQWMTRGFAVALVFAEVRLIPGVFGLDNAGPAVTESIVWGRLAFGQPGSSASLFRPEPDGMTAVLVRVEFGRSSALFIEVVRGLDAGDTVILSDLARTTPRQDSASLSLGY